MLIAGYFSVGALVWCWESAYNVLQGDDPAYGFSLFLVLLGLLPVVAGGIYFRAMRRRGTPVRGALGSLLWWPGLQRWSSSLCGPALRLGSRALRGADTLGLGVRGREREPLGIPPGYP